MPIRLDELNPPQRDAVTTLEGPVLVLAGAGSGKTRVITYRVAYLLEQKVRPDEVLAVSFTNKAADEMQVRIGRLVGERARRLTLSTFHALGLQMLKAEKEALGFGSGFTIYDTSDQLGVLRELLRRTQLDDRRFDVKAIQFRISRAKNAFISAEEYKDTIGDNEYDLITAELFPKYQAALRGFHALDFDDLLVEPVKLLDQNERVRERWQKRFRFVMVDEYQDTNRVQARLMHHLVTRHNNVCVVGDDDQSIYGWRGAEAGHILEFERHYPGARVIRLEENYRSTPHILNAANAVIVNNPKRHKKTLWTQKPPRDKLQVVVAEDAEAEAQFVAEEIDLLCATRGYKPGDFAVLYRSNIQSKPIEEALRNQRIVHRVVGGTAFFDRKEVKDAIAYLRLALAATDEISLRRIINYPARGIGHVTLERLAQHAKERGIPLYDAARQARESTLFDSAEFAPTTAESVEDLSGRARHAVTAFCDLIERGRALLAGGQPLRDAAKQFFEEAGIFEDLRAASPTALAAERRVTNLDGLLDSLKRFEERDGRDLSSFLHRLTMMSNSAEEDELDGGAVTLVTLHGSKGLEFPVVFLVGLEEELLPHRRTLYPSNSDVDDDPAALDISEERRLMYVGITRAQQLLYLSRARNRAMRSSTRARVPSRFLEEIPSELYERREKAAPKLSAEDEEAFARASLAKLLSLTD